MMIKAVIFDLDGTVTDTLSTIAHFGNLALTTHGIAPIPEEEYKYFAGDGKKLIVHRMLAYNNADTEQNFAKVELTYDTEYEADPIGKTTVFDGILPLVAELHRRGIKVAINSNKPHNVMEMVLSKLFPAGYLDAAYGQTDDTPTKPDPTNALKIAAEFGVSPSECLFVGDTSVDIKTGLNADMHTVGVLWGFRTLDELKTAGAEYIAEKPVDILDVIFKIENE